MEYMHARSACSLDKKSPFTIHWFAMVLAIVSFCIAFSIPSAAQLYSGSLTGVVMDPTGAVVPNAKVTVIDVGKQYQHTVESSASGQFLLRPLPPSTYTLIVEAPGFRKYERQGIVLDINANATVDVRLVVGAATGETIKVSADAPLLGAQDATTGQTVNQKFISELPLIGRQMMDLTFLAPGVNPAPGGTYGSLSGEWYGTNFSSNGGRSSSSDILVDGVSATGNEQNGGAQIPLYTPSPDAVQEFKVEQNNFSAELGYSGNTVVNVVTRSGTNEFKGSAYEYFRNSVLDAGNWYNAPGSKKPGLRYNDFGVTIGGPIRKNKTFFFADYEGTRQRQNTGAITSGVPSAEERKGNFGELCSIAGGAFDATGNCSVSTGQIWDPYSGVYDAGLGGVVHQAFIPYNNLTTYASPGNPTLIGTGYQLSGAAGDLIDPVAAKMMSYFPEPNNLTSGPGGSYNPYNNWIGVGTNKYDHDQIDVRIDQQFTPNNTSSVRFSWGRNPNTGAQAFNNPLDPRSGGPAGYSPVMLALNDSHTFSQNTVLTAAFGFSRLFHHVPGLTAGYSGFDPVTTLGFPGYIETSGYKVAPTVVVGDQYASAGYGGSTIGSQPWSLQRYAQETYHATASLSHVQHNHEFKFGGEMRAHRVNSAQPGMPDGGFAFDHGATSNMPGGGSGDAMASFMTGVGSNGCAGWGCDYEIPLSLASINFAYAGYALDNWKINNKITLNLGIRYELEIPRTTRHDKLDWFDPNVASPLTGVPCLTDEPCLSSLKGGVVFAGVNGAPRTVVDNNYSGVAPRFGISWQVEANTVVRAGYGVFHQPSLYGAATIGSAGNDTFSGITNWMQTYQNDGVTPWGRLEDPFPNNPHLIQPVGSSQGLLTEVGTSVYAAVRSQNILPYTQTWSVDMQHQFPGGILIDMGYVGTKGTHLYFEGGGQLNHLGAFVKSASLTDLANLQSYVDNPFAGIITNPNFPLSSSQVQLYQLYLPYPQFTGVSEASPSTAGSNYNALQVRLEKRMSHGLQFLLNYTWSKSMDNAAWGSSIAWLTGQGNSTGPIDPTNPSGEHSISQSDIPQVFNVAYVYELPFGKGKTWGAHWNPVMNDVLGGWELSGTYRVDNGTPIGLSEQGAIPLPGGYSQRPDITSTLKRNKGGNWKDQYFTNPLGAEVAQAYTLGNAPRFIASVRMPGTNTTTLSISKQFGMGMIHDGSTMEFKAQSFNALNHPQFCGPNTTVQYNPNPRILDPSNPPTPVTDPGAFGQVTSQCNSPREVQMGLRLIW